jgi:hypothetical protein
MTDSTALTIRRRRSNVSLPLIGPATLALGFVAALASVLFIGGWAA